MNNSIGFRIRDTRRQRGMTQYALAKMLGVKPQSLSQWERGHRPFPARHLATAAAALDVSLSDLAHDVPALPDTPARRKTTAILKRPRRWRRPRYRPPYPPGAYVEHVTSLSPWLAELHGRVRSALPDAEYRAATEEFPRDTRDELGLAFNLLATDSRMVYASTGDLRCPMHTMHDLDGTIGDELLQPVIAWRRGDERVYVFGQVWLNVPRHSPVRVDFLAYYKRRTRPGYWFYIEVDDGSHRGKRYQDAARAAAIALPGLRYENYMVRERWFFRRLLDDIRGLRPEARRRRREQLRRAREFEATRIEKAAQRRAVG